MRGHKDYKRETRPGVVADGYQFLNPVNLNAELRSEFSDEEGLRGFRIITGVTVADGVAKIPNGRHLGTIEHRMYAVTWADVKWGHAPAAGYVESFGFGIPEHAIPACAFRIYGDEFRAVTGNLTDSEYDILTWDDDYKDNFHLYTIIWYPDSVTYYIDNVLVATHTLYPPEWPRNVVFDNHDTVTSELQVDKMYLYGLNPVAEYTKRIPTDPAKESGKLTEIAVDAAAIEVLLGGGLPAALDSGALKIKEQSPLTTLAVTQATYANLKAQINLQQLLGTNISLTNYLPVGIAYPAGTLIDPRAVTIQSQANPFTNDIDVDDDAVQTLLGGGLPAALDGVSLKVKEQSPLTTIDIGNFPADYPDSAVATLLGGGLPSALVSDKLKVRASEIETLIGEVQVTPTAYTVLSRLKALEGYLDGVETDLGTIAGDTTSIDGKIPSDPAKESGKLTQIDTVLDNIYDKINELEDALNSVGTDYLRVLGKTGDPLFSIEDASAEQKVNSNAGEGTNTLATTAVPSGKIHVVTAICAQNRTSAITLIDLYAYVNAVSRWLKTLVGPARWTSCDWQGKLCLGYGDYISVDFSGCVAGDVLYLDIHYYVMDA